MAGPIAIITRTGRTMYKNARGRIISRSEFERETRRGPLGRFQSRAQAFQRADMRTQEALLRDALGGQPLGGGSWTDRAERSPDLFAEILADAGLL